MKITTSKEKLTDFLLIASLAFAPLALGSVHAWAYCTLALVSLVIFNLRFLSEPDRLRSAFRPAFSKGIFIFLLFTLLYMLPLPSSVVKILNYPVFALKKQFMTFIPETMTFSIYARSTMIYTMKMLMYLMFFLVIVSKLRSGSRRAELSAADEESRRKVSPYGIYIFFGALTAVLSLLIHSLSDFNLHIPANALYFSVFLAIITGLAGRGAGNDYRFLKKLVDSITIIGFGIAVFAILQKLSYNGKIYWLIKIPGSHFGPYINYDHFAGFMEMCTFMAIANFIARISASSFVHMKKLKDKIIWFSTREANKMLIYLFFAVVMTTALFMSTSRGGIMSFCAALAVFYFASVICAERRKRRRILTASVMVIVLIVIMVLWIGPESTVNRFIALKNIVRYFIHEKAILSELRPYFWKDTLVLIKDFPVWGTGLGTYAEIFQKYRTFDEAWGFLRYAHNDYLQFIAETGAFGGVFLIGFLLWYIRRFREGLRKLKEL
jgi:O-antigen ligase